MSKTLKTTQLKTKPKVTSETSAKKSTAATTSTTSTKTTTSTAKSTATATTNIKPGNTKSITRLKDTEERTKSKPSTTIAKQSPRANVTATTTTAAATTKSKTQPTSRTTIAKSQTLVKPSAQNTVLRKTVATGASTTTSKRTATNIANNNKNVAKDNKTLPLRAKHSAAIVEAVRKNVINKDLTSRSPAKPNAVLDTYHNVTVASPPSQRKEITIKKQATKSEKPLEIDKAEIQPETRRPRTRTLDDDEVVVLKSESAKQRSASELHGMPNETVSQNEILKLAPSKESVAFEVNFDEKPKTVRERSRTRPKEVVTTEDPEDSNEYSDDFESYASDFETEESSSAQTNAETEDDSSSESIGSENESISVESESKELLQDLTNNDGVETEEDDEDDDESELTQYPVTVIQRDKERERKLDSGNYEMNSRQHIRPTDASLASSVQPHVFDDSLDTFSAAASEQLDSGISSYAAAKCDELRPGVDVFYGGYADFNTRPCRTKRGLELMSKIQFDTLSFTFLDLKPISYDVYMQSYGKLNTTQSSTQTHDKSIAIECQTDESDVRSIWTQHPPQYDLQMVQQLSGCGLSGTAQNCCGELPQKELDFAQPRDEFDASLQALQCFHTRDGNRAVSRALKRLRKPVDCERLNTFLLNSALLMSRVLNANTTNASQSHGSLQTAKRQLSRISVGYRKLNTQLLNALRVVRIFANSKYTLVITVHESLPDADVYRADFSNLLMIWSTSDTAKPIRLLSTWSEVCRAEICNESSDIIVCGLRDGSVAMWDLRETYSFCSKLDGHLTHFAATQSIVPSCSEDGTIMKILDLGAVVDVKSFRATPKNIGPTSGYKSIQFTSLNDTGILTVWTLVETASPTLDQRAMQRSTISAKRKSALLGSKFEYSSPWARIKLIQSAICDLRDYLERGLLKAQSKFDKTKSLFQNNIYSDSVLRELNETHSDLRQGSMGLQGLRFTSIDTGCEQIYVCTNRNFILACSKSLKCERFRKIAINESRFLFPTALRVLANEYYLAVGLSNGSVMILNCHRNKQDGDLKIPESKHTENTNEQLKSAATTDYELETGKSCAIQNIILNERRSFESALSPEYDIRPSTTAACLAMINEQKKPFELRVYDQQILLNGSVLRKDLVQSLELCSDGWQLFALSNGIVRTYDFYMDQELLTPSEDADKVCDIAVARNGTQEQHLLILSGDGDVQVHQLKQ